MSDAPTPRNRRTKRITWLVIIALLLSGVGAGGTVVWLNFGDRILRTLGIVTNDYDSAGHGATTIVITEGQTGEEIAQTLARADVVKTAEAFTQELLARTPEPQFQPGSYRLKLQMSAAHALDALQNPENRLRFTAMIPEGKTVAQTLELIAAGADIPLQELQQAAADPSRYDLPEGVTSLEGWLFPATYEFEADTTGEEAIARLVEQQKTVLAERGVAPADQQRVLIIASMVQREGGRIADFAKVSRVIDNRLSAGMLLQMDSTAQYGMGQHEDGSVWSTDEALADDNPWNTYVHEGLPAGPIANPGSDAIDAALNPAPGPWLYFVAVNLDTGESVFSETVAEHEQAVQQLNQWCAANPGKGC